MGLVSTFKKGGVHPDDKKSLSKNSPIERIPLPDELIVSMAQHLGAPATALKKKGDRVTAGEKIGTASGFISAEVHSPVDGVVKEIRKTRLANGAVADALVITPDPEQVTKFDTPYDYSEMTSAELLALVKDLGIVGMGGATFPTHVKLSIPVGKSVDALVINGVECEPYLTADYRVMMEKGEAVLEGVMILSKILNPKRMVIGIELNKMDAIAHLEELIKKAGYPIEVMGLKMKYPQGDEKQLLKAVINKEIPSGKLPLDIGAVVCNLGTVNAIYEAVKFHKPLFERVITISGEAIAEPKNVIAPIGTKTSALLSYAGGYRDGVECDKLISGGPMMGFAFWDEDTPVLKGTSGILALRTEEKLQTYPCVACGNCVRHCPMGLSPNKMFRNIKNGLYQNAMDLGLMDCKECGCCAFSCPSGLPLVQMFRLGKKLGRKKK
jgi:electron transport complex, RnfABCDGE type, C subunit